MSAQHIAARRPGFMERERLQDFLDVFRLLGYRTLGPVVEEETIQWREVDTIDALPTGVQARQGPGEYRLEEQSENRLFAWNHGPQAIKPLLFSAEETLWHERLMADGQVDIKQTLPEVKPTAIFGVRACDLAALALQDRHFLSQQNPDPHYKARREALFLIGIDCAFSAATCFCTSTGDGPSLGEGFDIGMAELDDGYLVWGGSVKGGEIIGGLSLEPATEAQLNSMIQETDRAAAQQHRFLPGETELKQLYDKLNHGHWDEIGARCLSCGNCTAVCPTCFCYSTGYQRTLDGQSAEMKRQWESCFSQTHSSMGQFMLRRETALRYRQWLTHKLAGWQEQYGRSGCVGCGRCITWCPVGIDLTQAVAAILDGGLADV
ncbi:MAG: cytochrome C [Gammaproteobacteria bacterium (ex Lamellibrachia satsuma)]|nr:MAG: 4Fe-4S dicluster domain-containing protein [Gammaproteobacteria bacterium (ex Lamellibrachia satsuma)]RRS35134.1 MAG: cytochrome C [Gammaproteobacteria bacterium (ex Lamellibrachia satsuma)]